jgi:sterol desaturase/sphingolipid hydroxylase (fatty acid hydroxylase superfamily)
MFDSIHRLVAAAQDPAVHRMLGGVFAGNAFVEGTRYLASGLVLWLVLHVLLKRRLAHRLIGEWPRARDMRREFAYSLGTIAVFGGVGVFMVSMLVTGHMEIYAEPRKHGLAWLLLSFPLLLLWHDFYFYWTHRLLHTRWLFRHVHGVHHRSRHPSPWAAYAFHPVEALINGLVTSFALLAVPLHVGVLMAFGIHQIVRNAHGHAAVETMPRSFARHRFWGRLTTTTHHHLHHETAQGNYGLWFTWWDRLCGTERADYLRRFEAATAPACASPAAMPRLQPREITP